MPVYHQNFSVMLLSITTYYNGLRAIWFAKSERSSVEFMPLYLDHLERLTLFWVPLKANSFLFYLINVSELYTQL